MVFKVILLSGYVYLVSDNFVIEKFLCIEFEEVVIDFFMKKKYLIKCRLISRSSLMKLRRFGF